MVTLDCHPQHKCFVIFFDLGLNITWKLLKSGHFEKKIEQGWCTIEFL